MRTWEHEDMGTWRHEDMKTWEHKEMRIWRHENMKIWKQKNMRTREHERIKFNWKHLTIKHKPELKTLEFWSLRSMLDLLFY